MNLQDVVHSKDRTYYLTAEMRKRLTKKLRDENIRIAESRKSSSEIEGKTTKLKQNELKKFFERRKNAKEKTR